MDTDLSHQEELTETYSTNSSYVDAWYYLYSTVPQTFAAVYALLFGLALFRLQQIRQSTERVSREIDAFFNRVGLQEEYSSYCAAFAASHDWDLYLSNLEKLQLMNVVKNAIESDHEPLRSKNFLIERITEIRLHLYAIGAFWKQFQLSLIITGILIAFTTILIPVGYFVNFTLFVVGWIVVSVLVILTISFYLKLAVTLLFLRRGRAENVAEEKPASPEEK